MKKGKAPQEKGERLLNLIVEFQAKQQLDEISKEITEAVLNPIESVYNEGVKRIKQLRAPKQKKNKALLSHCIALMQEKPSRSAASLWRRIPQKEKAAAVDGVSIFRDDPGGDGEIIYCISPTGKQTTVGERAFSDYFKKVKNIER